MTSTTETAIVAPRCLAEVLSSCPSPCFRPYNLLTDLDSHTLQKLRGFLTAYQRKYIIIREPSFLFFCPHIHQYNLCFFYLLNLSSEEDFYLTRVDAIVHVHFVTEFQIPLEVAAYHQGYLVRPVECKRIPFSLEASKINCRLDR